MRDYFQIAGELWTGVIVGFLLLAVAHYAYGRYQDWQTRKRDQRMQRAIRSAIAKSGILGTGYVLWDGEKAEVVEVRADFPGPMGVNPPTEGWIAESRRFEPGTDREIIDRLTSEEAVDDEH